MTMIQRPAALAALQVLRRYGVEPDRCEVLQDGNTLVLRLTETLVARLVQDRGGPRQGTEWFARENAVAEHLTRQAAPVIPLHPDLPAGPHQHDGFPMNFWRYVIATGEKPNPREAGQTLQICHGALESLTEALPRLAILHESMAMLRNQCLFPEPTQRLLAWRLEQALERLEDCPCQPLHGDAHAGNLLTTTEGLLWTDWEDAFQGPVEWDVASLIWNARVLEGDEAMVEAMVGGYMEAGGSVDSSLLETCLVARGAVMCAWYPILYPKPDTARQSKLRQRLEWLAKVDW